MPAIAVLGLIILGVAAYFFQSAPTLETESPTASSTATVPTADVKTPAKTTKPAATPSTSAAPSTTAPTAQTVYVAKLAVGPKYPNVNTAPPVAAVSLTFALDSYTPQKKDAPHDDAFYSVDYGDGTTGAFKFTDVVTAGGAHEVWAAPDHTYQTPGTYTLRAFRSKEEIAHASITVFGDHLAP